MSCKQTVTHHYLIPTTVNLIANNDVTDNIKKHNNRIQDIIDIDISLYMLYNVYININTFKR